MFLVRTARSVRATTSAVAALAHAEEMRDAGRQVIVTNLGGRRLTTADLRRQIEDADVRTRHRNSTH